MFIILYLLKKEADYKASIPYLLVGERIKPQEMIDRKGGLVPKNQFSKGDIDLIFIFERPCSKCNKNINLWRKATNLFSPKVRSFGIVCEKITNFLEFAKTFDPGFELYAPKEFEKFMNEWRIRTNFAQTLLLKNNKIIKAWIGNLSIDNFNELINEVRQLTTG